MSPRVRTTLILLGTLVLGICLGALGLAALVHHRHERVEALHHPAGFVRFVMDAIEPRDEAQRRAILPYVEAAGQTTRGELRATHERLIARVMAMRDSLRPLLTDEQLERLESSLESAHRSQEDWREARPRHE